MNVFLIFSKYLFVSHMVPLLVYEETVNIRPCHTFEEDSLEQNRLLLLLLSGIECIYVRSFIVSC